VDPAVHAGDRHGERRERPDCAGGPSPLAIGVRQLLLRAPRVGDLGDCAGASAGWLSNFGQLQKNKQGRLSTKPYAGYADIYAVDVAVADVPDAISACLP
jgi:hypothetical protein